MNVIDRLTDKSTNKPTETEDPPQVAHHPQGPLSDGADAQAK
jgi:hypothetical protein